LFVASGCATTTEDVQATSEDALAGAWSNVLDLRVFRPGAFDTRLAPTNTIRPQRGRYVRVVMPRECGAAGLTGMTFWGRDLRGLDMVLVPTSVGRAVTHRSTTETWELQGGAGATVFRVGFYGMFTAPCTVSFEQGDRYDPRGDTDPADITSVLESIACVKSVHQDIVISIDVPDAPPTPSSLPPRWIVEPVVQTTEGRNRCADDIWRRISRAYTVSFADPSFSATKIYVTGQAP